MSDVYYQSLDEVISAPVRIAQCITPRSALRHAQYAADEYRENTDSSVSDHELCALSSVEDESMKQRMEEIAAEIKQIKLTLARMEQSCCQIM